MSPLLKCLLFINWEEGQGENLLQKQINPSVAAFIFLYYTP